MTTLQSLVPEVAVGSAPTERKLKLRLKRSKLNLYLARVVRRMWFGNTLRLSRITSGTLGVGGQKFVHGIIE